MTKLRGNPLVLLNESHTQLVIYNGTYASDLFFDNVTLSALKTQLAAAPSYSELCYEWSFVVRLKATFFRPNRSTPFSCDNQNIPPYVHL